MPAGRFKDNPNYLPRFYTSPNFDALQAIRHRPLPSLQTLSLHTPPSFAPQAISAACDAAGLSVLDAAFCWLLRHSALGSAAG